MKACKKCGTVKPLSDFYRATTVKDGHHNTCKPCWNARAKERREANLETAREYDRWRYRNHPGRADKQKATAHAFYHDDKDHGRAKRKEYYEANRERWEKYRAKRKALLKQVEHEPYTRREIYERDGGKCRLCDKELEFGPGKFEIDHIVPLELLGPDTPANVQLACQPCNRSKWHKLEGQIHFGV